MSAAEIPRPGAAAAAAPVEELVRDLAVLVPEPLDELHVAAVLESRGITDQVARDGYGADDVFVLARRLAPSLPERPSSGTGGDPHPPGGPGPRGGADVPPGVPLPPGPGGDARPPRRWTARVLAHGPLYVMPSVTYPALAVPIGYRTLVTGLVLSTALGWVWGAGSSIAAHHLFGQRRGRVARRMVRRLLVAGTGVAGLAGVVLARVVGEGPALVGFVAGQVGFQLACGVLVLFGRELRVAVLFLPATALGVGYLVSGSPRALVGPTATVAALSVAALLVAAWRAAPRQGGHPEPLRPVVWRPVLVATALGTCYGAVCALLLLYADARHVIGPLDLAIAVAPMVLGAGAVEWCAHHFRWRAQVLLHRAASPAQFAHEVWRVFLTELARAVAVLGSLGLLLLVALDRADRLTVEGAVSIQAHVVLGAVFFTGFVMAGHERFGALLAVVATGSLGYVVVTAVVLRPAGTSSYVLAFLATCLLLLITLLAVLRPAIGHVHHHR